jgi:hypothetical protein
MKKVTLCRYVFQANDYRSAFPLPAPTHQSHTSQEEAFFPLHASGTEGMLNHFRKTKSHIWEIGDFCFSERSRRQP